MEEFNFTWKIENFNLSVNKKGGYVSSPTFVIDSLENTAWFLQVYPYGETDQTYIACYLNRSNSDGGPSSVAVDFTLSFVKADGSEELLRTFEKQSIGLSQRVGCKDLKRLDDLLRDRQIFLPKNTLTVTCYIQICSSTPSSSKNKESVKSLVSYLYDEKASGSVSDLPPEIFLSADEALRGVKEKLIPCPYRCLARTKIRVEKRSLIWRIENFSDLAKQQRVSLPLISASNLSPSLLLTFYWDDESITDQHVQVELRKKKNFTSAGIIAYCEISLLNNRGKPCDVINDVYFFDTQNQNQVWKFPPFVKKSTLVGEKAVYLPNDTLSLQCNFAFSDGAFLNQVEKTEYSTTERFDGDEEIKQLVSLRDDLRNLSADSKLQDVVLLIGKDKFPAHKAVLSARSPVFKAMFERDMAEKESGTVKISDVDAETLKRMLEFMYGGAVENLQCESAAKLYSAADKYQCLSLRDECGKFLSANLCVANVCDVLVLADLFEDEDLKSDARDFILRHGVEVLRSEEWKTFMKRHTLLAANTLNHVGLMYMEA